MNKVSKAQMLTERDAIRTGKVQVMNESPRLFAKYGKYMPAELAAAELMRLRRGTSTRSRESWAMARLHLADPTRDRVRKA